METARELSGAGDCPDLFILVMAYWQMGDKEKARREYGEAVHEIEKNHAGGAALTCTRDEAAALLGIRDHRTEK
jgi:hypothetical protein